MNLQALLFELRGNVAWITLNRPTTYNAIDLQAMKELAQVANHCAAQPAIRAAVITGSGDKAFSAGGDVVGFDAAGDDLRQQIYEATMHLHTAAARFASMDAPLIAAVNGVAAGAGLSVLGFCDLAIASDTATFTSAYTRIGFTPDGSATWFLPRLIGHSRAMELFLTNRVLTAQEALEWGLINDVVPPADLMTEATALAAKLAAGPTRAFGGVKRLMNLSAGHGLESQLAMETRTLADLAGTADMREGIRAFIEKRKPDFRGA